MNHGTQIRQTLSADAVAAARSVCDITARNCRRTKRAKDAAYKEQLSRDMLRMRLPIHHSPISMMIVD